MENAHANCPCMETCPLNRALARIGGKWKMQILCSLHNNGTSRYNALRKSLDGVSNTVLAGALKELEQDGLIARQEYPCLHIRVGLLEFNDMLLKSTSIGAFTENSKLIVRIFTCNLHKG